MIILLVLALISILLLAYIKQPKDDIIVFLGVIIIGIVWFLLTGT
jgi:hypothetical protein